MTRPMVVVSPDRIGMKNLLGMELRTHTGELAVQDNKIFVNGKKKVSLWMFDQDESSVRSFLDAGS